MKRPLPDGLYPWLLAVVFLGFAFIMACKLEGAFPGTGGPEGLLARLFGEGRRAVSLSLNDMAEQYFHKGVERQEKRAFTNDWFQRVGLEVSPQSHRHTEGMGHTEILPWLQMATKADPHNVEAQLVLAFWLGAGINRPDLARSVLWEAQRNNPRDYQIYQEQGRMAIREGGFALARGKLETAISLWPSGYEPDRQRLLDKAEIQTLLGLLCEMRGQDEMAVESYKNTLAIFPERAYIKERMAMLLAGRRPEPAAEVSLRTLVRCTAEHVCTEEEHRHEGDEEESQAEQEHDRARADGRREP